MFLLKERIETFQQSGELIASTRIEQIPREIPDSHRKHFPPALFPSGGRRRAPRENFQLHNENGFPADHFCLKCDTLTLAAITNVMEFQYVVV